MAASPVKFLFGFLMLCVTLWILFIFTSRLLAWILSRVVGASIGFRFGGWKCIRDVVVKFKKGAIESISVGEVKLSLRQSLVKLGVGIISKDPKLQILICDLEIVTRQSSKSSQTSKPRKSRSSGSSSSSSRGKWTVGANIARFLSISVTDLVVRTPKATVEVKELTVDISRDGGSKLDLVVKLHILPILLHINEPHVSYDLSSSFNSGGCSSGSEASLMMMEKSSAPFSCEEFSLSCEFGHHREAGVMIHKLDISFGEVAVCLNEEMLVKKKNSSDGSKHKDQDVGSTVDAVATKKPQTKQAALAKYTAILPEKVSFSLPKLDVRFVNHEHGLVVENNIMGIQLKSGKSRSTEDVGESTRLDIQLEFSEIHLFREAGTSILEIMKVDVISFVYVPVELSLPVRVETDVKLGGTQCNIIVSRLTPWLQLQQSKKKKMVLGNEKSTVERPQSTGSKAFMWTCTVSAPEMTIVLYSINGLPLYHGCSQSSHVFANNISSSGTSVHLELGELNLHMADEYQESVKESLFGVESNSGSLLHIAKLSLDWGKKDIEPSEGDGHKSKLVLCVDVTGMSVYFAFKHVESLIVTAMSFKALFKKLSPSKRATQSHGGHVSKSSVKGTRLLKFNLERCTVTFCGEAGLDNTVVADPKRVNYGSQGGRVVISVSADGTPRTADVMSTFSDESKRLRYSVSLDIFHFSLCVNKEKQSTQVDLERARSIYEEHPEDCRPGTKVSLFDIQNAKFVRRSGGLKEISVCSLFSATDIAVHWEPDVHLALVELALQAKLLVQNQKLQEVTESTEHVSGIREPEQKKDMESGHTEKNKKKESIFAVDIEMLSISADIGDGVDTTLQVQSIFSENARIGVLLEGLILCLSGCRLFKSSRMQISHIPRSSKCSSDGKAPAVTTWDWVIQGLDIHICMPYRLELRAIDDAFEEMLRGLKLVTAAKSKLMFPSKVESSKPKKPSSVKFGCVKFCIRKLFVDIEEEPMQGWLDEHYRLMKHEASELAVKLNILDELISKKKSPKSAEVNDSVHEKNICYNGLEVDINDPTSIQKVQEEIHQQSFRSYYKACQKLIPGQGSGACQKGFQAGFKPSISRTSVLSISATDFDVSLTGIDGGDEGMIELLKKLDPVIRENDIPFSRLYGGKFLLHTGTLVVQLRDYTLPLLSASSGKCDGRLVLAQQATCFQPQVYQEVFIGRWRKVRMLRSATGTTPPMKTYMELPLCFQKGEVCFGVGFEPVFADVSYAFTVALRRANLSVMNPGPLILPPKKEKSLPWWDDMRNYIHGNNSLRFSESQIYILATPDPYENLDKLEITTKLIEVQQSDGRIYASAEDFKIFLSSLESMFKSHNLTLPSGTSYAFLEAPVFTLEVIMEWGCDSGNPLNHYLFAFPTEEQSREIVFDPFRSTSLSFQWNISFGPPLHASGKAISSGCVGDGAVEGTVYDPPYKCENGALVSPAVKVGAHDLAWLKKFYSLNNLPPHKLRLFSRFPRYGVPRILRSGNLPLDKVITEFLLRLDVAPFCIKHMPLDDDDPAKGLTFNMSKLKAEVYLTRGQPKYTFECNRDPLDLVYQNVDLHVPKVFLNKEDCTSVAKVFKMTRKNSKSATMDTVPSEKCNDMNSSTEKQRDDGFLLSSDYFTVRRQAPKADPARLLAWQEAGRRNLEVTYVRSEFDNGSESDEQTRSDPSDDEADNCQRVSVYGLKLMWNIENRDAVWSFVGGLSKAFEPAKPSPSRQYAQRKLLEEKQKQDGAETLKDDISTSSSAASSSQQGETKEQNLSPTPSARMENPPSTLISKSESNDDEEEGTRQFMVNVIEPQFNLHSEEANGRFLLAAVRGRVLARSFHSVLRVGYEMIEQALVTENVHIPESGPEMTWKRMELSVMLEHVQAHVAPTDVDPGAGLQWLPKIRRSSPKVKRTGALLERVFMPCDMYFRYTRHKGGTSDLKMKPLKELAFNSDNIMATMTSRQFQVMLDVLTNLLFARPPKPRQSSLSFAVEDDEDIEEEADEVVPDGVEEVELAKIELEQKERERRLILNDIRKMSQHDDSNEDQFTENDGDLWTIPSGKPMLVKRLKEELVNAQKSRKAASASLRSALQTAAQTRLMEKEKNKGPSCAMRISLQIKKVVWSMLIDGKSFAEAEINDLIYDFDRDYKDVGIAQFTTKYVVVRNCQQNAKSDTLLAPWNPPPEWGKKVMLRVDARQGAPKDGKSPLEHLLVEIYPLKIHLTETMYRMMWGYFFNEEDQDSQRRQEVWKVSTTLGNKRGVKKGLPFLDVAGAASLLSKESDASSKPSASAGLFTMNASQPSDSPQKSKAKGTKANVAHGAGPELRRTSSFDRTWEETVAESVANELVLQLQSSLEQQDEISKNKLKAVKPGARTSQDDKKVGKTPRKLREFHNIKISQVELLVTYEGSRFVVNDLKLLMDTFHRVEFTGTWRRLFSRVKKHIIWGVLKSVTGMQGKKFKDKLHSQKEPTPSGVGVADLNLSDDNEQGQGPTLKDDQFPVTFLKRPADGAGDGFVTSVKGLFSTQRRKATAFVLRTMRGEAENDFQGSGDWSESEAEFSPFARQLTINKAKKLIRRHTKKFRSKGGSSRRDSLPSSPRETTPYESDSSSGSSPYEDFHD